VKQGASARAYPDSIMEDVSRRISSPTFIGRAHQLAALRSAYDRSITREPAVVFLGGEAGVGKTRIVGEFTTAVSSNGARLLTGGCIELSEGSLPFAPIVEALRELIQGAGADEIDELLGPARSEFGRLLPELNGESASSGVVGVNLDSAQTRFFEVFLGFLHRLAESSPTVLVIEDLHWADDSTRDLLTFLIRNLRQPGIMLLVTYRSDEVHRRHPLRPFLSSLDRLDGVERLELQRFDRGEVYQQLRSILDRNPDLELVDQAFQLSEGNPFYVEELIVTGYEPTKAGLPSSLLDAVLVRVETLSKGSQEMLKVAATAGKRVDHALLECISSLDGSSLGDALRDAVAHHILVPDANESSYAFRHALIREAIYSDLLPAERTSLHAAFAEVLQRRPDLSSRDAAAAAELAYHFHEAKLSDAALRASIEAGRAAEEVLAFSEALTQYERALELWSRVDDVERSIDIQRVEVIQRAAQAAYLCGRMPRSVAHIKSAIELFGPDGDPVTVGLLYERLGRYLWTDGNGDAAAAAYREAMRLLPAEPPSPERARVLAAQGQMLMLLSRFEESRAHCEEAVHIAKEVGASEELGHALNTLGVDLVNLGEVDAGIANLREARRIALEINNVDDVSRTYANLPSVLVAVGRYDEALADWDEGMRVTKELGTGPTLTYYTWYRADRAEVLYRIGRWDEAETLTREPGDEQDLARAMRLTASSEIATGRGRLDQARADIEEAARYSRNVVDPQFVGPFSRALADLALWSGEPERARAAVENGLEALAESEERGDPLWLCYLGIRAEADLTKIGQASQERALDLLNRARRLAVAGALRNPVIPAAVATADAEFERFGGEANPASFGEAARLWHTIQHDYVAAYCWFREGEALIARGEGDGAVEPIARAHEIAARLHAAPLLQETESLARRARLKLDGMKPERSESAVLTARELEVLRLVAEGRTNSEIGNLLFISTKTASVHVSHILAKLGVSSRVQAAGLAHDQGLLESR
jgi:DNA-binding CsgD family transcriptional regulator/tetratricopeptide (TPR) repeat protein